MRRNREHEKDLELAHKMFDERNLITELKWQRKYLDTGYLSVTQVLFNKWIFDECLKRLEERKVGKWILSRKGIYTCSICGLDVSASEVNHQGYVYCPKCGNRLER